MDTELVDAVMVSVLAAVGAVGHKALTTVEAAAADATADPAEEDFRRALRGQVKKALAGADGVDDPELAADLTGILAAAGVSVSAIGVGAVAVSRNEGIISTGDGAVIIQHRR